MTLNPRFTLMAVVSAVLFCSVTALPGLAQEPVGTPTPPTLAAGVAKAFTKIDAAAYDDMSGVQKENADTDVGFFNEGSWLEYKDLAFNPTANAIDFEIAGTNTGGTFEARLDSLTGTKLGALTVQSTGDWTTWKDVIMQITPTSGTHALYIVGTSGKGICNLKTISLVMVKVGTTQVTTPPVTTPPVTTPPATATSSIPADYAGKPYNDAPFEIPGTIQGWQYDISPDKKNDVTFHYNGGIGGNIRKSGDGISVTQFGGTHVNIYNVPEDPSQIYLGWTQPGQWMKYTVHVKEAGTYEIGGHYACGENPGATLSFSFTPNITVPDFTLPTTVGYIPGWETYHVWETVDNQAEVTLPAGDCVMTVKVVTWGGLNLGYYTFHKKGEPLPPTTTGATAATGNLPDLVISKVTWDPPAPKDGDKVTFSAVVKNQGTAPTPEGTIIGARFLVDTNPAVIWSDNDTSALAPGKEVTITATGGTAGSTWTATSGTHTINALVDDVNRIPESDETNNLLKVTLTVP